eukprot:4484629-Alexandrium_andersonii.AAC.1
MHMPCTCRLTHSIRTGADSPPWPTRHPEASSDPVKGRQSRAVQRPPRNDATPDDTLALFTLRLW